MDDTLEEKKKKKRKLKPNKNGNKILILLEKTAFLNFFKYSFEALNLSLHKCDLMHTYDSRISKETLMVARSEYFE